MIALPKNRELSRRDIDVSVAFGLIECFSLCSSSFSSISLLFHFLSRLLIEP